MNIFKQIRYDRNHSRVEIKVDVRKHLPLYFLMNNINTACYMGGGGGYINDSQLKSKYVNWHIKYPFISYEQFLQDPIFNNDVEYSRDSRITKREIKSLLFYKSLKSLGRQGDYLTGLGSLLNEYGHNKHTFVLCVKKGYEKYVQMCLLLEQEFEFDCLYFIYTKNTFLKHPRTVERILLKEMLLYCKNYKIDTIELEGEFIEDELQYDFKADFSKLTNIKSMKDKLNNIHQMVISNGL